MSAYIEIPMPILDQECLIESLKKLGFDKGCLEIHGSAVQLEGYRAAGRDTTAHIVIRKRHISQASSDIGFRKTPSGYRLVVYDADRRRFNVTWQKDLVEAYTSFYQAKLERIAEEERKRIEEQKRIAREERRNVIVENAKNRGYIISEERQGNTIKLVLVRREY